VCDAHTKSDTKRYAKCDTDGDADCYAECDAKRYAECHTIGYSAASNTEAAPDATSSADASLMVG
jgi:hypothetical protein